MKRLAALAAAALLASGCGHGRPAVPPSAIAVVGDRPVTRAAFDTLMAQTRRAYAARGRPFPATGTPADARLRTNAVRLLVEQARVELAARRLGVEIPALQVAARLRRFKQAGFGGNEKLYREALRREGQTDAQVRAAIRTGLLVDAVKRADPAALDHRPLVVYAPGFDPADAR